ncbi:MAG TPA: S-layer homology domain-containing protein [Symbiobacteriaceae bacterium]|nr:S-layer homology domain-containing protein [Symbiobacteriaceae bacterium]
MNKKLTLLAGAVAALLALPPAPALASTPTSITLPGLPSRYRAAVITLTMEAGALQIQATRAPGLQPGTLLLQGVDSPIEPLQLQAGADGVLHVTQPLPAGTYTLTITPAVWQGLTITGPDLQATTAIPQVSLSGPAYPNANEGVILNPTVSGASALLWNGPDGQAGTFTPSDTAFEPLTLPTTSLADGLYLYTVLAPNAESGNVGITLRPVLIDRQGTFPDMPTSHWARRWVEAAYYLGIVSGRPDGSFAPDANVTRAEFAKLLAATLGLQGGSAEFADIKGHWATSWIQSLGAAGIVKGDLIDGQRYFYPDRTISRQEAAAMVARAFARQSSGKTPTFTDWSEVEPWATEPVAALVGEGWLSGFPDGTFGPRRLLSRSQAAKLLGATFGM